MSADLLVLREFESLSFLLGTVPHRSQRGLFANDVSWTCFDVTDELFAIGTNTGCLYVYDRPGKTLKHSLSAKQDKQDEISKVKIIRSVDTVIAVGRASGAISIFQLLSVARSQYEEVRVFLITDFHQSAITSLEWSQNAMKLFSGDSSGIVSCTEIDYILNSSKSYVVHRESPVGAIVQLSYSYRKLLVSSVERSFIVHFEKENQITQIGKAQRKRPGSFGAVFLSGSVLGKDVVVYAVRPGLRLWKASIDGAVELTHLLQESISGLSLNIHPLHEIVSNGTRRSYDFGPLHVFCGKFLLTFHETGIYVIDPDRSKVICYHLDLGEIVDVAVNEDEVFVLRKSENDFLVRLSEKPSSFDTVQSKEMLHSDNSLKTDLDLHPPQVVIKFRQTAAKVTENIANKVIKEVGEKLQAVPKMTAKSIPTWVQSKISRNDFSTNENQRKAPPLIKEDVTVDTNGDTDSAIVEIEYKENLRNSNSMTVDRNGNNCDSLTDQISINSAELEPGIILSDADMTKQVFDYGLNSDPIIASMDSGNSSLLSGKCFNTGKTSSVCEMQSPGDNSSAVKHSRSVSEFSVRREVEHDEEIVFSRGRRFKKRRSTRVRFSADSVSLTSADSMDYAQTDRQMVNSSPIILCQDVGSPDGNSSMEEKEAAEAEKCTMEDGANTTALLQNDGNMFDIDISLLRTDKPLFELISAESTNTEVPESSSFHSNMASAESRMGEAEVWTDAEFKEAYLSNQKLETQGEIENVISGTLDFQSMPLETTDDSVYLTNDDSIYSGSKVFQSDDVEGSNVSLAEAIEFWTLEDEDISQTKQLRELTASSSSSAASESSPQFMPEDVSSNDITSWREFYIPACLSSIAVSARHILCTDELQRVHYSSLNAQNLRWHTVENVSAQQIVVSPSGWIVWCLSNGTACASIDVSQQNPCGVRWAEAARDVVHIAVDDTEAWYIKVTGEVEMQKNLSREQPSYKATRVPCSFKMSKISCRSGVVCGITSDNLVVVRQGITRLKEEGTEWKFIKWNDFDHMIWRLVLGENGTAWLIDLLGRLWYSVGFSSRKTEGEGTWWQVSLNSFLMCESNFWDAVKSLKTRRHSRLPRHLLRADRGLISAQAHGLWIYPSRGGSLHFCPGNVVGYRWHQVNPLNMFGHKKWMLVSATGQETGQSGLVWLVDSFGSMFCFIPSTSDAVNLISVDPPEPRETCCSFSASAEVAWCLLDNGHVYIRRQMAGHCLPGYGWDSVDMVQIGWGKLAHVSIGSNTVWGVHSSGTVYLRIGVKHRSKGHTLNPAWLKLDSQYDTDIELVVFKHIFTSPDDSMVWAIDDKNRVYARIGVTEALPIGLGWQIVEGSQAKSLCISRHQVYATTPSHDLMQRIGITANRPEGDYWRTLPGSFQTIAVNAKDELWAIDKDGDLYRQERNILEHPMALKNLTEGRLLRDGAGTVEKDNWVIY